MNWVAEHIVACFSVSMLSLYQFVMTWMEEGWPALGYFVMKHSVACFSGLKECLCCFEMK